MEKSFKFKHIENNLLKLLTFFLDNQNIKKYIYHLVDDPISQTNVTIDLIENDYIILTMFDENILTEEQIRIFFNPMSGSLKSQPVSEITYIMDIIIPNNYWVLHGLGQLRAFRIADEFAQDIDQQLVAGIGECEITNFKAYKVGKNYSGLSLWIKVCSASMKGLR
jgi:hypothetical protein